MSGGPDKDAFAVCGRCSSGRRWFWYAQLWSYAPGDACTCGGPTCQGVRHLHGWEDTEASAVKVMHEAAAQLGADPARTSVRQGDASYALKRINAAKRAAQPAKGDTGTNAAEYLYGVHSWNYDGSSGKQVIPFQITKKTAKRIYYIRVESWESNARPPGEPLNIGYIDRHKFETPGGEGYSRTDAGEIYTRPYYSADHHLFATREAAEEWLYQHDRELQRERAQAVPKLKALKAAMAAAHPDRGGTDAEFIAARKAYQRHRAGKAASGMTPSAHVDE